MIDNDTRMSLSNPMRAKLDTWEQGMTPTRLKLATGLVDDYEGLTDEARSLKNFAVSMQSTIKEIGEVYFKAIADKTLTDAEQLSRAATHAAKKIKAAGDRLEESSNAALTRFNLIKESLQTVLTPENNAGKAALDMQVIEWVKSHKPEHIPRIVRQHPEAMAAVAKAPSFVTGLAPEVHDVIKNEYLQKMKPDEYARYEELQALSKAALQAYKSLDASARSLIDFDMAEKITNRKFNV